MYEKFRPVILRGRRDARITPGQRERCRLKMSRRAGVNAFVSSGDAGICLYKVLGGTWGASRSLLLLRVPPPLQYLIPVSEPHLSLP